MHVVKVTELIGESSHNWNDAVQNAVKEASTHIPNITGVEVYNLTCGVRDGRLMEYKANVKVAYKNEI
ncbi:MAG: dodecin family protein [Peptococcaceae bacterium]|nr:dodecin family protein [Peptococcaceae bacterium]